MEKIKNYIERFLKNNTMNNRYDMCFHEVLSCMDSFNKNPVGTICTTFNFGYAKGYRAAMAEMRKGGVAS